MAASKIQSQASEKLALASSRIFLEESHGDRFCKGRGVRELVAIQESFYPISKKILLSKK